MTTPTSIVGIQQFAKNRLLSLHDACVSVTQTPKQTKIEKSFEHLRGGKRGRNGKSWLSSVISPGSAGYGRYIVDPNNHKKASPISSSNKNNNSSSNYMLSTAGADMDPNSEFFTAINNYSNAGVNNASRKMKRKEYEDLPRHVPRHVVQPLQEAPHSPSSPIANFSLIPLFALCRNQHQITIATNPLKQNNNVKYNTEEIVRRRQQNVFLLPSKNFPNWCPSVNFTSINTNNNETENSSLTIVSPRHVLPRRLKPIHSAKQDEESSFLISPSFVESDKGRNSQEMNFIVGEGRFVIPEVSDEKKSNNNNNVKSEDGFEQTGESQIFVSFFQLAVPLPSSLYSVVVSSSSQKQASQTLALDFWIKKFTLARLLRPSSPSFFQMSEISGLWWYFVWMHRNYSLRWLLDINHLFNPAGSNNNNRQIEVAATTTKSVEKRSAKRRFFLPSAAGTSSIAKKSGNKKKHANRKNSPQGGGPAEIAIDESETSSNNKNDKQDAAILSQLLTTFTSRPVRDADNFGQRKSRENARYERYDIGKRRRKGKALKKKSSLLKRKLLKQQQGSSSSLTENNTSSNKKNGGTKKYSSAQEYILHRLAIKFSLLKPHQLRSLVDHYRLFLHHCNVTCTNEKNLWKLADEKSSNNNKFEMTSPKEKSKKQVVVLSSSKAAKLQAASSSFASQLTHTSIQLPQETYLDEIKVWREWRFVYSFFPIFALKAAMFGSGLPLKKVVDSSSSSNNETSSSSSSLAKVLGFDFILKEDDETKKKCQETFSNKRLTEMTELVCFPNSESSLTAFERISSSSSNSMMMSSGMHKSQILEKNNNSNKTSSFMLDPASVLSSKNKKNNNNNNTNSFKYHLSTELSKLELSLLKTRSGYWVFRNSLPALEPQKWWKHFVVSTTTCARQWEMLKGQQRTLFDTLPLKRKSGERRSDPFFAFLRKRVAEASAMRKAQLEMIRKERRGRGEQQQQNNNNTQQEDAEDEDNITKFPFLSKETNLPTTLGQVCAQARRDWNKMHPFEQAQYYDQDAIKQTFPEFEGFKQEDAQLWKSLLEEEEYRQKMLDQMELEERWSYNKNGMFYSDYTNGEDFTLDLNSLNSGNSSSVNDQDLGIMSMMMRQNSTNSSSSRFRQQQQMYYNDPLRYKLGNDEEMSLRSAIMIANNNNNNNKK